jgi:hypothetical protein
MEPSRLEGTHEQIAIRAYCRWEQRGRPIGSPEEAGFMQKGVTGSSGRAETSLFIDINASCYGVTYP